MKETLAAHVTEMPEQESVGRGRRGRLGADADLLYAAFEVAGLLPRRRGLAADQRERAGAVLPRKPFFRRLGDLLGADRRVDRHGEHGRRGGSEEGITRGG